jgi:hypothetical protein
VEPARLLQRINDIKQRFQDGLDAPYGVDVVNRKGDRLTVAFDDREGFLMHQPGNAEEWVQYSLGDPVRDDTRVFYLPQWTELSGRYMVPTGKLVEALQDWATMGRLSSAINWTTEIY